MNSRKCPAQYLVTLASLGLLVAHFPAIAMAQAKPDKALPIPGETWFVEKHPAFLILPAKQETKTPLPWVWYAPTLPGLPGDAEKWMFERFTAAGIAIAGIDVGESYGSPRGRALFSTFYAELVEHRGLGRKPVLLARSRGGLMSLSWAADHPHQVGAFAGIYPVCNLESYPGLAAASGAYEMSAEELRTHLKQHNPVERLEALAKAGVPLFAIHGDSDRTVPLEANSGEVKRRYLAFGREVQLLVPKGQGHNMWSGFFQCQELVNFVVANAKP